MHSFVGEGDIPQHDARQKVFYHGVIAANVQKFPSLALWEKQVPGSQQAIAEAYATYIAKQLLPCKDAVSSRRALSALWHLSAGTRLCYTRWTHVTLDYLCQSMPVLWVQNPLYLVACLMPTLSLSHLKQLYLDFHRFMAANKALERYPDGKKRALPDRELLLKQLRELKRLDPQQCFGGEIFGKVEVQCQDSFTFWGYLLCMHILSDDKEVLINVPDVLMSLRSGKDLYSDDGALRPDHTVSDVYGRALHWRYSQGELARIEAFNRYSTEYIAALRAGKQPRFDSDAFSLRGKGASAPAVSVIEDWRLIYTLSGVIAPQAGRALLRKRLATQILQDAASVGRRSLCGRVDRPSPTYFYQVLMSFQSLETQMQWIESVFPEGDPYDFASFPVPLSADLSQNEKAYFRAQSLVFCWFIGKCLDDIEPSGRSYSEIESDEGCLMPEDLQPAEAAARQALKVDRLKVLNEDLIKAGPYLHVVATTIDADILDFCCDAGDWLLRPFSQEAFSLVSPESVARLLGAFPALWTDKTREKVEQFRSIQYRVSMPIAQMVAATGKSGPVDHDEEAAPAAD